MNDTEISLLSAEVIPPPSSERVAACIDCGRRLMIRIIKNEKIEGTKRELGPGILKSLHREILNYYPGWAGKFRLDNDVNIVGREITSVDRLEDSVYQFETWLQNETDNLQKPENREDLYGALRVAAAAHYAVVGELHPFDDGNGRLARVLMNGILMLNTKEGLYYNYYIFPVPMLRNQVDEKIIRKTLEQGKEPKLAPYLKALRDVDNTWVLNPFEVYIAGKWTESISNFLTDLETKYKKTPKDNNWKYNLNNAAIDVVNKFIERKRRLFAFIEMNRKGQYPLDKVPDFYALKYLAVDKA